MSGRRVGGRADGVGAGVLAEFIRGKANRSPWQHEGRIGELLGVSLGTQLPERVSFLSEQKAL